MIKRSIRHIRRIGSCWWTKYHRKTIRSGVGAGLKFTAYKASHDYTNGKIEYPVQIALKNYLKRGDIFFDIGANVGFFTILGARIVGPSGHVYAFEPVPEIAACNRRNARLNNFHNVTVFAKAVSFSTGKGQLLLTQHPGGSKLSTAGTPLASELTGTLAVDVISIDNLVAQQDLAPPMVVKIDVEGAELDVLAGMRRTINRFKPVIIYEIDHLHEEGFLHKCNEVDTFLNAFGYEIITLEDAYPNTRSYVRHAVAIPRLAELMVEVQSD